MNEAQAFIDAIADAVVRKLRDVSGERKVLTTKEAAKYIRRSEQVLRVMVANGELPAIKNGRRLQFVQSDLDQWVERSRE